MKKLIYYIKRIFDSVILAGMIILFIGLLCYVVVKAGIPYQDPLLDLQIKYAVNMGIGEELMPKRTIT